MDNQILELDKQIEKENQNAEKLNQIEKDERFLIAQYRVIKAMGKQEELMKIVDEMTYDEE